MAGHPGDPRGREWEEAAASAVTALAVVAVLAAVRPVMIVTAAALAAAPATGMRHARLPRAAPWSLVMTGISIAAVTVQDRPWAPGTH